MILTVICNVCQTVLAVVEKDVITQQDQDLYKQNCHCDTDDQQDIECSISEE